MDFAEARNTFIHRWGELGPKWGISKSKAQVHALLLISPKSLSTDEVMEILQISRGSACMSLKSLMEWELVYRECPEGCRKEHYHAEKDMYHVFRQIIIHRKRKELEPLLHMMDDYACVEESCSGSKEFCQVMSDIRFFATKADSTLDSLLKANPNWFVKSFMSMVR
ncbi:MAG: transcriptional regulator [Saprospiraceae bacterium]|nr:transcriptional regulator [Saprospiraceae bacterium]